MFKKISVTIILLLSNVLFADIYTCKGTDGTLQIQDRPCNNGEEIKKLEGSRNEDEFHSIKGDYYSSLRVLFRENLESRGMMLGELPSDKEEELYEKMEPILKIDALQKYTRILVMEHRVKKCSDFSESLDKNIVDVFTKYKDSHRHNIVIGRESFKDGVSYPEKNYELTHKEIKDKLDNGLKKIDGEFMSISMKEKVNECNELSELLVNAVKYKL